MTDSTPAQLFDGSQLEAVRQIESPDLPPETVQEPHYELPEFKWEQFKKLYHEVFPAELKQTDDLEGARQRFLVDRMSGELIGQLFKEISVKTLWSFLKSKQFSGLRDLALKGFQQTPAILRNQAVRNRLAQHFTPNRGELHILLLNWAYTSPPPPVLAALIQTQGQGNADEIIAPLIKEHGLYPTWLATTATGIISFFIFIENSIEEPDALQALIEKIPNSETPALSANETETGSETALYWREKAEVALARLEHNQELAARIDAREQEFNALRLQYQKLQKQLADERQQSKTVETKWAKKLANAEKRLTGELEELKKHDERQSRRYKATDRERDELEVENRRLKKQLRHTQQLLEETRKKVPVAEPSPQEQPEVAEVVVIPPNQVVPRRLQVGPPPHPFDEIFEWQADGRTIRLTARDVKRQIDKNDEDAIFTTMMALDALENRNRELYFKFLHRLKTIDAYYASVLTRPTTRVLVDASNVARSEPDRRGRGQIELLFLLKEELRRRNCWPLVFIADASLPYNIDDSKKLRQMIDTGEIVQAPSGVEADEILAREARKTGAFVVTNDAKFHFKVSPDFEPPRITFRVYDGTIVVDEF